MSFPLITKCAELNLKLAIAHFENSGKTEYHKKKNKTVTDQELLLDYIKNLDQEIKNLKNI